jgi:hypothetical protein
MGKPVDERPEADTLNHASDDQPFHYPFPTEETP